MITHDLGVVAEVTDDVVVMYGGQVVEQAPVDELFYRPCHPYTWGLLGSLPRLDAEVDRLVQIPGQPPSLMRPPSGCRFHPRCAYAMDVCRTEVPALEPIGGVLHHQRCWLDEETKKREGARIIEMVHEVAS
jgi:oligopeptide/dipeptide ABC transporter ATP-binding protein